MIKNIKDSIFKYGFYITMFLIMRRIILMRIEKIENIKKPITSEINALNIAVKQYSETNPELCLNHTITILKLYNKTEHINKFLKFYLNVSIYINDYLIELFTKRIK